MTRSSWLVLVALLAVVGVGAFVWTLAATGDRPAASELASTPLAPEPEIARPASSTSAGDALEAGAQVESATEAALRSGGARGSRASAEDDAVPDDALWVEGRVLVPAGTPADERVEVVAHGARLDGFEGHSARIADDGTFRVAFHPKTRFGTLVLRARYLYLAAPREIDPREEPDGVELSAELGGLVELVVAPPPGLAADEPRPESIHAAATTPTDRNALRSARAPRGTDDAYRCELGGLVPDLDYLVSCAPTGWRRAMQGNVRVRAGERIELRLEASLGARIAGRVVTPAGEPVAEARVWTETATQRGAMTYSTRTSQTTSDGEGRFLFYGLDPGEVVVHARISGRLPAEVELGELADGRRVDDVELVLEAGLAIAGRVVWPDGRGVEGAVVELRDESDGSHSTSPRRFGARMGRGEDESWTTGADGAFEIAGLGDEPVDLVARYPAEDVADAGSNADLWLAEAADVQPGTQGVVLVLASALGLSGKVVDQNGDAVTAFQISARPANGRQGGELVQKSFESADGRFVLPGLKEGDWNVLASAAEHAPAPTAQVTLPRAEPVTLVVQRAARIVGRVVGPGGEGVAGARVTAQLEQNGSLYLMGQTEWGYRSTLSRKDGLFEIGPISPGAVKVEARASGYARGTPVRVDVAPGAQVADVLVALVVGGRVEGRLEARDGNPLEGRTIQLALQQRASGVYYFDGAQTDADARFVFEDVPPGDYTVSHESHRAEVTVEAGRTSEVVLGRESASEHRIVGTVTRGGQPIAEAVTAAYRLGDGSPTMHEASTDELGVYALPVSASGTYFFYVRVGDSNWSSQVEVPEAGEARLDVDLSRGALRGTVLAPDGEPAAGIYVYVRGQNGNGGSAQTGENGAFELAGLVDGTLILSATPWQEFFNVPPYISPELELRLEHGGPLEGVKLQLEEPTRIEGVVLAEGGRPAIGAELLLVPTDPRVSSRNQAKTDGTGRFRMFCPEGRWLLRAWKGDTTSPAVELVSRAGDATEVELALTRGTFVDVAIEGVDDPIWANVREVGATAALYPINPFGADPNAAPTRARRLGPLPPGTYEVTAQRVGATKLEARGTFTVNGESSLAIELEPLE